MSSDEDVPELEDLSASIPTAINVAEAIRHDTSSLVEPSGPQPGHSIQEKLSKQFAGKVPAHVIGDDEMNEEMRIGAESLQAQLMEEAKAARPRLEAEEKKKAEAVTKTFMKGTAIKKGFLNLGSSKPSKSKSNTSSSTPSVDNIIDVKPSKPGTDSLRIPEVQEAMKANASAMENTLKDKSWMTPEFLQQVAKDPRIMMGMQNPRYMQALGEFTTDAKKAMEKYKNDQGLQDFVQTFMAMMGNHFTELGKKQDTERGSEKPSSSGSSTMDTAPFGLNEVKSRKLDSDTDFNLVSPGVAAAAGAAKVGPQRSLWPNKGVLASDSNVPAEMIADAAKSGKLPTNDEDVRAVLSNKELVDVLRDPKMQRILEECRADGSKLTKYLADPELKRKFMVMQEAGLIKIM